MIKISTEITKKISKEEYYNEQQFIKDAKAYIKAVDSGRALFTVTHVSSSGMSRNINIKSFEGKTTNGYYRNFTRLFETLGFNMSSDYDIKVSGCGMDMVWNTNYTAIKQLHRMGFMSKAKCDKLSQKING